MGVTVSVPGQQSVYVTAGPTLTSLGTKTEMLTGAEQTLCEQPKGTPSQITGYVDLSNLHSNDIVILKFYVKLTDGGLWQLCYKETYSGIQELPIIHIQKRPENHGVKVTIQQTSGTLREITHEFFEEG